MHVCVITTCAYWHAACMSMTAARTRRRARAAPAGRPAGQKRAPATIDRAARRPPPVRRGWAAGRIEATPTLDGQVTCAAA
jgi:hypothetical protein